MRTVLGFSCFFNRTPVEMFALWFLGCFPRLGILLELDKMFFSLQRSPFSPNCAAESVELCPRCRPSLFFCNRVLSSSSVPVITLVSTNLCTSAGSKSKGASTSQFFQSIGVSVLCHESFGFQLRIFTTVFAQCLSLDFNGRTARPAPVVRLEPVEVQFLQSSCFQFSSIP